MKELKQKIALAQQTLYHKLNNVDIKALGISEYNQKYLDIKLKTLAGILQLYGRILHSALADIDKNIGDITVIDYGGGSGLLSLLAAEMGIGKVIYNDIFEQSCGDVKKLSQALELELAHIICGDVDNVIACVQENKIAIDAMVSYDVLEHIYDVKLHFAKLGQLKNQKFRLIYASGANPRNPRYSRFIKKAQLEVEYQGKTKKWGHKASDSLGAYYDLRKKNISEYKPQLKSEEINMLAKATRGLIKSDIEKCVDEYCNTNKISYAIKHPTNTCDPYNGNWAEHLMEFDWLEEIIKNAGFDVKITPGQYNISGHWLKLSIKWLVNIIIAIPGPWSYWLAPYYVVMADKK